MDEKTPDLNSPSPVPESSIPKGCPSCHGMPPHHAANCPAAPWEENTPRGPLTSEERQAAYLGTISAHLGIIANTLEGFLHEAVHHRPPSPGFVGEDCRPIEVDGRAPGRALETLHQVSKRVEMSESTIKLLISDGGFPRAVDMGTKRKMWRTGDVDRWIAGLEADRG